MSNRHATAAVPYWRTGIASVRKSDGHLYRMSLENVVPVGRLNAHGPSADFDTETVRSATLPRNRQHTRWMSGFPATHSRMTQWRHQHNLLCRQSLQLMLLRCGRYATVAKLHSGVRLGNAALQHRSQGFRCRLARSLLALFRENWRCWTVSAPYTFGRLLFLPVPTVSPRYTLTVLVWGIT